MSVRIVFASLIAVGCGGGYGGGGEPDAAPERAFSTVQAKLAGKLLAAAVEDTAQRFGPILTGAGAGPECATLSGDLTDGDGDAIPASAKLVFDCSQRRIGYTGTLSGVESVTDEQPEAIAWAFTVSADLHSTLTGPFGGSMLVDVDGTIAASQGSAVGPFALVNSLDVVSVVANVRGTETVVREESDWAISYAPGVEWTPGGLAVVGELFAEGVWDVSINDVGAAATLATPSALVFRPSCDSRITAGVVEAAVDFDVQSATIRVEWTGCGQRVVSYDLSAE